jgi:uncharacterized protein with von Willebrand factor type A (vWA) domain
MKDFSIDDLIKAVEPWYSLATTFLYSNLSYSSSWKKNSNWEQDRRARNSEGDVSPAKLANN